ncbi:MAG TPA: hypothetical protein VME46_06105 [Acidimicrobiales bacterium]|nr:hypothetical protein [Acidimicrobiales bacterium]
MSQPYPNPSPLHSCAHGRSPSRTAGRALRRTFAVIVITFIAAAGTFGYLHLRHTGRPLGLVQAGDSKTACLYLGSYPWQQRLTAAETATGIQYTCLETFADDTPSWQSWVSPWVAQPQYGYAPWVRQSPGGHTLVLTVTLIPRDLSDNADPLTWEAPCDAGAFDGHARALAAYLVASGLGYSVVRLGVEPSGPWEDDFVGTTPTEQHDWALCFDAEVKSMRSVGGSHFLFDWNVNACYEDIPFGRYYPGNNYVDLVGIDLYDTSCAMTLPGPTPSSWADLGAERNGLDTFDMFARRHNKPMSIPEWGLQSAPNGDDPYYVDGIARFVGRNDVAFQAYFDSGSDGILPLGLAVPKSLQAYRDDFVAPVARQREQLLPLPGSA